MFCFDLDNRPGFPAPSERRARVPRVKSGWTSCCSRLHLLRVRSLLNSQGDSRFHLHAFFKKAITMFGFGRKKNFPDWLEVAAKLSALIWTQLQTNPKVLASPFSRIVLRQDGSTTIACDERNPNHLLGWGDLTFVFLQEHPDVLKNWISSLRSTDDPRLQLIHTEEFAKAMTRALMQSTAHE